MTIDYVVYPDGLVKGPTGCEFRFRGVDEARAFVRRATGFSEPAKGDGVLKTLALNVLGIALFAAVCALAALIAEKGMEREDAWFTRLVEHAKTCDGNCAGEYAEWCPSTRVSLGLAK